VSAASLVLFASLALAPGGPQAVPPPSEVIAEVRIHGNHVTPDEDVVKLSGLVVGAAFMATTIADATSRLKAAKRFDAVTVAKRFASIEDASKIVVVIVVNEGPVRIEQPDDPNDPVRVVPRRGFRNLMFMPIFDVEDGYGVTAGARLAYVGAAGSRSRLSFPLTAGGTKRAGVEFDRTFSRGPLTRVELGSAIQRQKNPAYDVNDDRRRLWARAERVAGPLRLTTTAGKQWVTFGGVDDDLRSVGGAVAIDTRVDPVMPRNALFATASIDRLFVASGGAVSRTRLDGRGYLGLFRQNVLVLRAVRESADATLPLYLRSMLGGWSSLRGFAAGSFTGDTMVAGSAELRVPLNSPVAFGKIGVSVFVDTGAAYDRGQRFRDQPRHTGVGGSAWITVAALKVSFSVARGLGASTRVNFGGGLSF
jgi:outer membrane protein assembly factor BamA